MRPPRTIHQMRKSALVWYAETCVLEQCKTTEEARQYLGIEEGETVERVQQRLQEVLERQGIISRDG